MRVVKKVLGQGIRKVAIVIPVKDAEDAITAKCVEHLERTQDLTMEVHLVESSGDEFSFGRSINAGVNAAAPADIVICMDSDAYPDPGALSHLLDRIAGDPRLGYAAAKVRFRNQRPQVGWVHCGLLWFVVRALRDGAPLFALRRLKLGKWWSFGVRSPRKYKRGRMVGATTTLSPSGERASKM